MIMTMVVFMLETLKLSKTLKSSRDDFNVLDNFNVSRIKTVNDNGSNITVAVKVIVHDRDSNCWNGKELLMI